MRAHGVASGDAGVRGEVGEPLADGHAGTSPMAMPPPGAGFRADFAFLARWLLLGASAGGVAGLLVGGVGGRLAMLLLRLTSPDRVRGVTSDDGFTIGRISTATFGLLVLATGLGVVAGGAYAALRGFLPPRLRVATWAVAGATLGGSALLHDGGVDFVLLEPRWLAVLLFVAIPAAGAALMAALAERWHRWWWTDRRRTALAAVFAAPVLVAAPVAAAALALAGAVAGAGRVPTLRAGARSWGRPLAWVVTAALVAAGGRALVGDVVAIL